MDSGSQLSWGENSNPSTTKTASSRGSAKVTSGGHVPPKKRHHSDIDGSPRAQVKTNADDDSTKPRSKSSSKPEMEPLPTQFQIITFLECRKKCCSRGTRDHCCLETYFLSPIEDSFASTDTTKLCRFITALRKLTRGKTEQEFDEHVIAEVRRSIKGVQSKKNAAPVTPFAPADTQAANTSQFTYEWTLSLIERGICLEGPFIVCREVFAYAWGISLRQIKNAVESIRASDFGYNRSSKTKPLKDNSRYFEDFSYDDVETTIRENVLVENELGTFDVGRLTAMELASGVTIMLVSFKFLQWLYFLFILIIIYLLNRQRAGTGSINANVGI